jgi:hypothetical protein
MEKEVILLVLAALISTVSSLITIIFNYRLSRRLSQEQKQHEAQKELRKSLTYGLDDVYRAGLGPLRGKENANQDTGTGILPKEVANLEVDTKKLVGVLNNMDMPSVKIEHLLQLALEIDKTDNR